MDLYGKIVVLVRTSSVARIPVYLHLRTICGVKLIVVHPIINPVFEGYFDHWIVHDTNDADMLHAVLVKESANLGLTIDAVISFDEYGVFPAACVAVKLGVRPIPMAPASLQHTNVKSTFREFCATHGISSPKSIALRSAADTANDELFRGFEFPVVIKPSPGAGSLLAKLCSSLADLRAHAGLMWSVLGNHPDVKHLESMGVKIHLIVEQFIGGQEVDIDCVIQNGVIRWACVSDNFEVHPPYFVERGGICPSVLPPYEVECLMDLLRSYVAAEGPMLHGVLHFEAKYDFSRNAAYVIEVNCRMGSAETNTMIHTAFNGFQLGECLVRCAVGASLDSCIPKTGASCFAASVNIYPNMEGILTHVAAPVNAKSLVKCSISQKIGANVAPPPKSFFLLSWMVSKGGTSKEALENIQEATRLFEQEIRSAQ